VLSHEKGAVREGEGDFPLAFLDGDVDAVRSFFIGLVFSLPCILTDFEWSLVLPIPLVSSCAWTKSK
jgi:hypothetical protein